MRKVQTPSGPFAFRLYFEDLGEIDKICLEALRLQSLLPSEPAPIRIERFVEKQFKAPLRYEDLGPEHLGCTIFNSSGAVEAIVVSRLLEEQNTIPARRRVRSTIAHEAGHGLLHGPLFIEGNSADPVNDAPGRKAATNPVPVGGHSRGRPAVLRRPMVGIPGQPSDGESSASELADECFFKTVRHRTFFFRKSHPDSGSSERHSSKKPR